MHGDLGLSDFCEGSDRRAVSEGWADSVGFGWTWPLDPKIILGHPGVIRMILLHGQSYNFSTTLPKMAAGGKAYVSRSTHDRLSASTAETRGSGTSDTNRGNLLLNLLAHRSILGWSTCCILSRRPLEGETTLSGWSGLVWIACLLQRSAGLECVRL